jgi:hypothetical protein
MKIIVTFGPQNFNMRQTILMLIFFGMAFSLSAQTDDLNPLKAPEKNKKSQWYITWGYTRAAYSRSTIHFKDESQKLHEYTGKQANYNFTIYDVKASDQADFDKLPDVINITIPQYVCRVGYSFNEKWGIELNYDHTKYVVNDWQIARIEGQIDDHLVDGDTLLDPDRFLHFEHTDGANFLMLNAVRNFKFYNPNKNFGLSWVVKPGAGLVIPRTDVTLFGEHLNNDWHVAGWIAGLETGLRMEFFRNGFFELVTKGSYADYRQVLVLGKGNGRASHHFFTGQVSATIGVRFGPATRR